MADLTGPDAETILDGLAVRLAARLNLALVQQIPGEVLAMLVDGATSTYPLYTITGRDAVNLRLTRRGNVLEVDFWCNGQTVTRLRFEGVADHG